MISVTVILVHYGDISITTDCLRSLINLEIPKNIILTILMVNNTQDSSVDHLMKLEFPSVKVITPQRNLGFAEGNNIGIKYALEHNSTYVWLVNNDTIADNNALHIIDVIKSDVGIVGSKIYFAPGTEYHQSRYTFKDRGRVLWYAGGIIDWKNVYASHRGVDEIDNGQYEKIENTDFVTGCSMLLSVEMLRLIGLFDPRYFLYLEDLDLCVRARKAGYKILYNPHSVLWHKNGSSSGKPGSSTHVFYQVRNRILFANTYSNLRTKFAILRESIVKLFTGNYIERMAITAAYLGIYGERRHL